MRALIVPAQFALALLALGQTALAQDGNALLEGKFGSASDPAASCAANPHELVIIDDRPHLARIWQKPVTGSAGGERLREIYDVVEFDGTSMILTEEDLYLADPEGTGGPWELKMTTLPVGYCWRRPDWPEVRCEDQQLRCDAPVS